MTGLDSAASGAPDGATNPRLRPVSWEVIIPVTGNTAVSYDTREEAEEAARWYEATYGAKLLVVGFNADGVAVAGHEGLADLLGEKSASQGFSEGASSDET